MIWFNPDNKGGGFDLGTPDWSGSSEKLGEDVPVSNVIIGQPISRMQTPSSHRMNAAPEPAPEPEPPPPQTEPEPDPRVENNLKLLAASISGLASKRKEVEERDLHFCIEMAFTIAEQLACGFIEADKTKVLNIVKESLGMFEESDKPVVRLHPDIIEAFEEHELLEQLTSTEDVTVKSDASVSAMGCVVTAERKKVNGDVRHRLERLKTLFKEEQGGDGNR
ncbi:MAG: hypothetical protein JXX29_18665 [Deltaproteobacteria bacterium]|nr:hypothetical protein [Deltaproteobacteria bacterium]MBN2673709.1 hypothetical protein [Deltaproteobacteria bacterium]